RLAAARRADEHRDVARVDVEAELAHGDGSVAVVLAHRVEPDQASPLPAEARDGSLCLVLAVNGSGSWIWGRWVALHPGEIGQRLQEHVVLTAYAVGIGFAIAFPLGIFTQRHRRWYGPTLGITSGLYTLPSIALFGLMIPIFHLSRTTA